MKHLFIIGLTLLFPFYCSADEWTAWDPLNDGALNGIEFSHRDDCIAAMKGPNCTLSWRFLSNYDAPATAEFTITWDAGNELKSETRRVTLQPGENSAPSFSVSGIALDEVSVRVIADEQTIAVTQQTPTETQPLQQNLQETEELHRAKRARLQEQEDLLRAEKARQQEQAEQALAAEMKQKQEQNTLALAAEMKRKQEQEKLALAAEMKQKQEQDKLALAAEMKRKQEQDKIALAVEKKRKQEQEKLALAAETKRKQEQEKLAMKRKQDQEIRDLVAEMKRKQEQRKLSLTPDTKRKRDEEMSQSAASVQKLDRPVLAVEVKQKLEQKGPARAAELNRQQEEIQPAPLQLQPEESGAKQGVPPLLGQPYQGISKATPSSLEDSRSQFSGKKEYSFTKPATDCITTFINADMNDWLAYQNNCSSPVHLFYSNPGFGSLDIGPGEVETSGWECDESCTPSFGACPEGYAVLSTTMEIYTPQMQREKKSFLCGKLK